MRGSFPLHPAGSQILNRMAGMEKERGSVFSLRQTDMSRERKRGSVSEEEEEEEEEVVVVVVRGGR